MSRGLSTAADYLVPQVGTLQFLLYVLQLHRYSWVRATDKPCQVAVTLGIGWDWFSPRKRAEHLMYAKGVYFVALPVGLQVKTKLRPWGRVRR